MDSADLSIPPSDQEIDEFLIALGKAPPFASNQTEYQLFTYLVALQKTGEIREGKSKVIRNFRRKYVLSPTESRMARVDWKDSAERGLYRRLTGLLSITNAEPAFGIAVNFTAKGAFQIVFKRKQNAVTTAPVEETPQPSRAASNVTEAVSTIDGFDPILAEGQSADPLLGPTASRTEEHARLVSTPAAQEMSSDSVDTRTEENERLGSLQSAQETPLSPAEIRAEEHARLVSSQVGRLRSFSVPPYFTRAMVLAAIAGVLIWFLACHRPPILPPVLGSGIVGIGIALAELVWRNIARSRRDNKIAIRVAQMGTNRFGQDVQELVMRSIDDVLATDVVSIERAEIDLSIAVDQKDQSKAAARRYLKKHQCDVLIWGKVYCPSQMKDGIFLQFSTAEYSHGPRSPFEITQDFVLDAKFGPELGTAVAAVAASMALPFKVQSGLFRTTVLEPIADKLLALVESSAATIGVDRAAVLQSYGLIQLAVGENSGETKRLEAAIDALRQAVTHLSGERVPRTWAMTQNTLGLALMKLADQQVGCERLFEAGIAFMSALNVWRGDEFRMERGAALQNLAIVQSQIGDREVGSENLERAVETFRKALETVEDNSRLTALMEISLAVNLIRLGKRQKDSRPLREAIRLAETAAETLSYALLPTAAIMANLTLAAALETLGDRENDPAMLERAISTYRQMLRYVTRKRALLQYFNLQINLAVALIRRGEVDIGATAFIYDAVKVIETVLSEPIRDLDSSAWANAQNTLGGALFRIGEREESIELLTRAEKAHRHALEEWTEAKALSYWAVATNGLASALAMRGALQEDRGLLRVSICLFYDAEEACNQVSNPPAWAFAQNCLAVALTCLGIQEAETESLEEAIRRLQVVRDYCGADQSSKLFRMTRTNLENARTILNSRIGDDRYS